MGVLWWRRSLFGGYAGGAGDAGGWVTDEAAVGGSWAIWLPRRLID